MVARPPPVCFLPASPTCPAVALPKSGCAEDRSGLRSARRRLTLRRRSLLHSSGSTYRSFARRVRAHRFEGLPPSAYFVTISRGAYAGNEISGWRDHRGIHDGLEDRGRHWPDTGAGAVVLVQGRSRAVPVRPRTSAVLRLAVPGRISPAIGNVRRKRHATLVRGEPCCGLPVPYWRREFVRAGSGRYSWFCGTLLDLDVGLGAHSIAKLDEGYFITVGADLGTATAHEVQGRRPGGTPITRSPPSPAGLPSACCHEGFPDPSGVWLSGRREAGEEGR